MGAVAARNRRVRDLREAHGLTQERLAELSGLSRVDICRIENGHNKATSYAAVAGLARAFGASPQTMADYLDGGAPALIPDPRDAEIDRLRAALSAAQTRCSLLERALENVSRAPERPPPESWRLAGAL